MAGKHLLGEVSCAVVYGEQQLFISVLFVCLFASCHEQC